MCCVRQTGLEIQQDLDVLRISGIRRLDAARALDLQRVVAAALTGRIKTIELDLSQTVFLDSCGLGALIGLRNAVGRCNGAVLLRNPTPLVVHILEMTRLHRVLEIVRRDWRLGPVAKAEAPEGFDGQRRRFGTVEPSLVPVGAAA
jgi:anti-anti-sigma factor